MHHIKLFPMIILLLFSTEVLAYGSSSSSKKACKKPTFDLFTPAHLSVVAPESTFSFVASKSTDPESIEVKAKKLPVDVVIDPINNGYQVSGTLPASLTNTYARIEINAKGVNRCPGADGWLLKIE